jgi:membrane protein implicated in regulation of membrane protease activity
VYLTFAIGWLLRDRLGVPKSRLRGMWVVLIVLPLTLAALLLGDALFPWWVKTLAKLAMVAAFLPWLEAQRKGVSDPLVGREARVVVGHPSSLQVEVSGEFWNALAEPGTVVLQGESVRVLSRDGVRLVVGR